MTNTSKTPSARNPLLYYADEQLEAGGRYDVTESIDDAWQAAIEVNEDGGVWFVMTGEANHHEKRLGREITREDLDHALDVIDIQLYDYDKDRHPVSVDFACNSMEYGDGDRFLEWTFPAGHISELFTAEDAIEKCWKVLARILGVTDPSNRGYRDAWVAPYTVSEEDEAILDALEELHGSNF